VLKNSEPDDPTAGKLDPVVNVIPSSFALSAPDIKPDAEVVASSKDIPSIVPCKLLILALIAAGLVRRIAMSVAEVAIPV